jgi:salicylate hydroxylase
MVALMEPHLAAGGIKSTIRQSVVGDAAFTTARPSGMSAFRFTIPRQKVQEIVGKIPEVLDSSRPAFLAMIFPFDVTRRSVVMYPCRNFELLNFVCIVPGSSLKSATTESWTASGDRSELVSLFEDYPDWVTAYFW